MLNLITDIPGIRVGNAHAPALASGVTVAMFDEPAIAAIAIHGGAPGVRDTGLLEAEATATSVDAIVLSGGSAFGLDSCGGVMMLLRESGRGFSVGSIRVPIVPGAVIFDLAAGGALNWGRSPPWWQLGYEAAASTAASFALGTAGAGYGATTANVKGGLGSASMITRDGFGVAALAVVNAVGSVLVGDGPHFWAAADERGNEFGGLGFPRRLPADASPPYIKGDAQPRANTTIALVATDAVLTKPEARRLAIMAHDGMARAIRPSHTPLDGDLVFAAATGGSLRSPSLRQLTDLGDAAAACLARAIARGVYEATALPFPNALPAYRDMNTARR